ncbi:hypothetical protein wTpre_705 [Wolbachia endosymbiont of Trichogramma pretiosum]|nr:hypothetical protein wTpre_705 [Wolbachia endosymbiont of Trichogramma pretiosum]
MLKLCGSKRRINNLTGIIRKVGRFVKEFHSARSLKAN